MRQPGISFNGSESLLWETFSRGGYALSTVPAYYIFNKMSKRPHLHNPLLGGLLAGAALCLFQLPVLMAQGAPAPPARSSVATIADAQVVRAKSDLERTERLVA